MKKRKKASPSASRRARGGPVSGPSKEPSTLRLPAECTVSGAAALKEQLAGLIDDPLSVTLDITSLQRIDTAALQVITAFVRERAGQGRPLEWHGSQPVLTTAAQLLGLTSLLKLPA